MRFKLRALFVATAAIACLLTWAIANGWLSGDIEERNLAIMRKLEQPAELITSGWTVADLASHLKNEHKIPVFVSSGDASRFLDDQNLSRIRLKNCIRVVLHSEGLSFAVRNGRLEILDRNDNATYTPQSVYSQGDLVAPRQNQ